MNKPLSRVQQEPRSSEAEYFNLHASGCGYLSRVRWVNPGKRRGGRTGEQFLACAINALRGDVGTPNYTYFDLRVSGQEAIDLIEQLRPSVEANSKVFVAFKLGDFYAHPYERDVRDGRGQKTGEKEIHALIKGRLLLVTHVKVDGEVVYQRDNESGADGQAVEGDDAVVTDDGSVEPDDVVGENEVPEVRPAPDSDRPALQPVGGRQGRSTGHPVDRTRIRSYPAAA